MRTGSLAGVLPAAQDRLLAHYGPIARGWIENVPGFLAEVAGRWKLTPLGYHDAGHASIVAVAEDLQGRQLLLKAWFEPDRYRDEITVLRLWAGRPSVDVIETADDLSVALMELVGGRPGGSERPEREAHLAAAVIHRAHAAGSKRARPALPRLADHLQHTVLPRVVRRTTVLDLGPHERLVRAALPDLYALREAPGRTTVLHTDLYRANVIFDSHGRARLIDPLPQVGDAVFDWAFWCVYYDLNQGVFQRMAIASRISRIPLPEIAEWCRALALDGFLYYRYTGDPDETPAADVLAALTATRPRG